MLTSDAKKKLIELLAKPRKLVELSKELSLSPRKVLSIVLDNLEACVCYIYELSDTDIENALRLCSSKKCYYALINSSIILYSSSVVGDILNDYRRKINSLAPIRSFWTKIHIKRVKGYSGFNVVAAYNKFHKLFYVVTEHHTYYSTNPISMLAELWRLIPYQGVETVYAKIPTPLGPISLRYRCRFIAHALQLSIANAVYIASLFGSW